MDNLTYYREVQGVMTRFEPLTDAALQATAEDGLTVSEIKSALERHGLDAKHVVHDPSRALFSTYYAALCGGVPAQRRDGAAVGIAAVGELLYEVCSATHADL